MTRHKQLELELVDVDVDSTVRDRLRISRLGIRLGRDFWLGTFTDPED